MRHDNGNGAVTILSPRGTGISKHARLDAQYTDSNKGSGWVYVRIQCWGGLVDFALE